ncbi:MAG: hypothetical protein JW867_07455, partial [Candidatus Omnitrophica bacterium]|nr:hypothetical protein [Candidatus Omnitrophota bacterium]
MSRRSFTSIVLASCLLSGFSKGVKADIKDDLKPLGALERSFYQHCYELGYQDPKLTARKLTGLAQSWKDEKGEQLLTKWHQRLSSDDEDAAFKVADELATVINNKFSYKLPTFSLYDLAFKGEGNCLSMSAFFFYIARSLGLEVKPIMFFDYALRGEVNDNKKIFDYSHFAIIVESKESFGYFDPSSHRVNIPFGPYEYEGSFTKKANFLLINIPSLNRYYKKARICNPESLISAEFHSRARQIVDKDKHKQFHLARDLYAKAYALDESNEQILVDLAVLNTKLGRVQAVIRDLNKAISLNPFSSEAYVLRSGYYYQVEKDLKAALRDFNTACKCEPLLENSLEALRCRATILGELGYFEQALELYERAMIIDSNDANLYFNRSLIYANLGRKEDAYKDYQRAKDIIKTESDTSREVALALKRLGVDTESTVVYNVVLGAGLLILSSYLGVSYLKKYRDNDSEHKNKNQVHNITAAGQFAAAKQYPEYADEFNYIGKALLEIVTRADERGWIELRGPPEDFAVARHNAGGSISWNITIDQIRDICPLSSHIIPQIIVHELMPDEREALGAQIRLFEFFSRDLLTNRSKKPDDSLPKIQGLTRSVQAYLGLVKAGDLSARPQRKIGVSSVTLEHTQPLVLWLKLQLSMLNILFDRGLEYRIAPSDYYTDAFVIVSAGYTDIDGRGALDSDFVFAIRNKRIKLAVMNPSQKAFQIQEVLSNLCDRALDRNTAFWFFKYLEEGVLLDEVVFGRLDEREEQELLLHENSLVLAMPKELRDRFVADLIRKSDRGDVVRDRLRLSYALDILASDDSYFDLIENINLRQEKGHDYLAGRDSQMGNNILEFEPDSRDYIVARTGQFDESKFVLHPITARAMHEAALDTENSLFAEEFNRLGNALLFIVEKAKDTGMLGDLPCESRDFAVARRLATGVVDWPIVPSGSREDAVAFIEKELDESIYDSEFVIEAIDEHENYESEEEGLEGLVYYFSKMAVLEDISVGPDYVDPTRAVTERCLAAYLGDHGDASYNESERTVGSISHRLIEEGAHREVVEYFTYKLMSLNYYEQLKAKLAGLEELSADLTSLINTLAKDENNIYQVKEILDALISLRLIFSEDIRERLVLLKSMAEFIDSEIRPKLGVNINTETLIFHLASYEIKVLEGLFSVIRKTLAYQPQVSRRLNRGIVRLDRGSGFIAYETEGHYIILTNTHVIPGQEKVKVDVRRGKSYLWLGYADVILRNRKEISILDDVAILALKKDRLNTEVYRLKPLEVFTRPEQGSIAVLRSGYNDNVCGGVFFSASGIAFLDGALGMPGDSGSPIVARLGNKYYSLAINTRNSNQGVMISPKSRNEMLEALNKKKSSFRWIHKGRHEKIAVREFLKSLDFSSKEPQTLANSYGLILAALIVAAIFLIILGKKFLLFFGYIRFLDDLKSPFSANYVGEKAYNLMILNSLGIPVPRGFVLTVAYYAAVYKTKKDLTDKLCRKAVKAAIRRLGRKSNLRFGSIRRPLLVSVRSNSTIEKSMVGLLDSLVNVGINDQIAESLAHRRGEKFAYDTYRRFIEDYGTVVMGVPGDILYTARSWYMQKVSALSENNLSAQELRELISLYKQLIKDYTGQEITQDVYEQLFKSIEAVFASFTCERAEAVKLKTGLASSSMSVLIQAMVFGNLNENSASGTFFTENVDRHVETMQGVFAVSIQGEDIVAGLMLELQDINTLGEKFPEAALALQKAKKIIKDNYDEVQTVEFVIEDGRFYLIQSQDSVISVPVFRLRQDVDSRILFAGRYGTAGAQKGVICFSVQEALRRAEDGQEVILFLTANESMHDRDKALIAIIHPKVVGLIAFGYGNEVAHETVRCRTFNVPAVLGVEDLYLQGRSLFRDRERLVEEGDNVIVDADNRKIVITDDENPLEQTGINLVQESLEKRFEEHFAEMTDHYSVLTYEELLVENIRASLAWRHELSSHPDDLVSIEFASNTKHAAHNQVKIKGQARGKTGEEIEADMQSLAAKVAVNDQHEHAKLQGLLYFPISIFRLPDEGNENRIEQEREKARQVAAEKFPQGEFVENDHFIIQPFPHKEGFYYYKAVAFGVEIEPEKAEGLRQEQINRSQLEQRKDKFAMICNNFGLSKVYTIDPDRDDRTEEPSENYLQATVSPKRTVSIDISRPEKRQDYLTFSLRMVDISNRAVEILETPGATEVYFSSFSLKDTGNYTRGELAAEVDSHGIEEVFTINHDSQYQGKAVTYFLVLNQLTLRLLDDLGFRRSISLRPKFKSSEISAIHFIGRVSADLIKETADSDGSQDLCNELKGVALGGFPYLVPATYESDSTDKDIFIQKQESILIDENKRSWEKKSAVIELIELGSPKAAKALIEGLANNSDHNIRLMIFLALREIGTDSELGVLAGLIGQESEPENISALKQAISIIEYRKKSLLISQANNLRSFKEDLDDELQSLGFLYLMISLIPICFSMAYIVQGNGSDCKEPIGPAYIWNQLQGRFKEYGHVALGFFGEILLTSRQALNLFRLIVEPDRRFGQQQLIHLSGWLSKIRASLEESSYDTKFLSWALDFGLEFDELPLGYEIFQAAEKQKINIGQGVSKENLYRQFRQQHPRDKHQFRQELVFFQPDISTGFSLGYCDIDRSLLRQELSKHNLDLFDFDLRQSLYGNILVVEIVPKNEWLRKGLLSAAAKREIKAEDPSLIFARVAVGKGEALLGHLQPNIQIPADCKDKAVWNKYIETAAISLLWILENNYDFTNLSIISPGYALLSSLLF